MKRATLAFSVISAIVRCLNAEEPVDPRGWNKAKWGMTQAQVVAAFDGKPHMSKDTLIADVIGQTLTDLTKEQALALSGVIQETLMLDEFLIDPMKFRVEFHFDEKGALREILLSPIGDRRVVSSSAYSNIRSALTDKYGNPSRTDDRKLTRSGGTESGAEWLLPSTVIHITLLEYGSSGGYMSLAYRRREKASDAI